MPYDPAIPLLGIYLKKTKTLTTKGICTHMFIAALFMITKTWNQPKYPSVGEWIKKTHTHTHTHTHEYYSAVKKKELLPFVATWMDLEVIMLK